MARRIILLILAASIAVVATAAPATADDHSDTHLLGIIAPGDDEMDAAQIVGELVTPGSRVTPDPGEADATWAESSDQGEAERPVVPTLDFCSPTNLADCTFTGAEPTPPPAGEPAVTLRDIASFRPAAPGNGMEPGGWAVVGLPANFVAEASVQTLSGTLLGRSADVRFHPVAYRWTHSDGAVVQASVPGSTWEELTQAEFTETATSHVYARSGEHAADLTVVYVAEYRFDGSDWRWIDGTLAVPGEPRAVLVGEFDTVLVTGDCNIAPDGPGC